MNLQDIIKVTEASHICWNTEVKSMKYIKEGGRKYVQRSPSLSLRFLNKTVAFYFPMKIKRVIIFGDKISL